MTVQTVANGKAAGPSLGGRLLTIATVLSACSVLWLVDSQSISMPGLALLFGQIFAAICAALMTVLWSQRRESRQYLWLAILACSWMVYAILAGSNDAVTAWKTATTAALPVLLVVLTDALLRQIDGPLAEPWRWARWVVPVGVSLLMLVTPNTVDVSAPSLLHVSGLFCLLFTVIGKRPGRATPIVDSPPQAVANIALAFFLAIACWRQLMSTEQAGFAIYGAAIFLGVYAWRLLSDFIDDIRQTEALNVELDQLVQSRTRELSERHREIQKMQRDQLIASERERIMRDMHDGLGGHLVSTLALLDAENLDKDNLREGIDHALTDMRLMVDSLAPIDNDLNAVLARFRERIQPSLDAAGVTLRWQVDPIPRVERLSPNRVLGALRIMQETISNSLKHARAKGITVATQIDSRDEGWCQIQLADDGVGFDPDSDGRGYGIDNMQYRAKQCGFGYRLESEIGLGTTTTLSFAIESAVSQQSDD